MMIRMEIRTPLTLSYFDLMSNAIYYKLNYD